MTTGISILAEIKTETQQGRPAPTTGWEWSPGCTPLRDPSPGKWIVRRTADSFDVMFRSYLTPELRSGGPEYWIGSFNPTDTGELGAREMAIKLRNESYRQEAERNGHNYVI